MMTGKGQEGRATRRHGLGVAIRAAALLIVLSFGAANYLVLDYAIERAERDPKISFAWNSEVVAINGDPTVSSVTLRDTLSGETRDVDVNGLFIAIGHDPRSELVKGQIELDDEGYVLVDGRSTATNLPGVFACGDLVDHTYRQAITAAGSGCSAALDAERYLQAVADRGELVGAADAAQ